MSRVLLRAGWVALVLVSFCAAYVLLVVGGH
jgi:hypothetical protein